MAKLQRKRGQLTCLLLIYLTGLHGEVAESEKLMIKEEEDDKPLFLTPLITAGKTEEARRRSRVGFSVESYSGLITVDQDKGSNLFFFLVKSKGRTLKAPLILWLQGGPGQSSLFTEFVENGPIGIDGNGNLYERNITIQEHYDILYLDQPVGAGYSFTRNLTHGFAQSLEDMASDMEIFLQQFLFLFKEYKKRDFYISGESYGVRPAASLAVHMHDLARRSTPIGLNLKGVILGVGLFLDVQTQLDISDYYLKLGLVYVRGRYLLDKRLTAIRTALSRPTSIMKGLQLYFNTFRTSEESSRPSLFFQLTGYLYNANALNPYLPSEFPHFERLMKNDTFKALVHVGANAAFRVSDALILRNLVSDLFRNVSEEVEFLLAHNYSALVYAGQVDLTFPVEKIETFLLGLKWPGAEEFRKQVHQPWWGDMGQRNFAGYVKCYQNFMFVTLRSSGHYVFLDQPKDAHEMVRAFIEGRCPPRKGPIQNLV
ncbi:venom serine carboxypeptidase-like [Ornithodoros turicata]|uniref:venom serine carboxypeptidase-like n=1 Tax=Ornithodoros turicata TaxID=34597 RepID=UPI00313947BD